MWPKREAEDSKHRDVGAASKDGREAARRSGQPPADSRKATGPQFCWEPDGANLSKPGKVLPRAWTRAQPADAQKTQQPPRGPPSCRSACFVAGNTCGPRVPLPHWACRGHLQSKQPAPHPRVRACTGGARHSRPPSFPHARPLRGAACPAGSQTEARGPPQARQVHAPSDAPSDAECVAEIPERGELTSAGPPCRLRRLHPPPGSPTKAPRVLALSVACGSPFSHLDHSAHEIRGMSGDHVFARSGMGLGHKDQRGTCSQSVLFTQHPAPTLNPGKGSKCMRKHGFRHRP